jgi:hypothetical protein
MTTTPPLIRVPTQPPDAPVRPIQLAAAATEVVGPPGQPLTGYLRQVKRKLPDCADASTTTGGLAEGNAPAAARPAEPLSVTSFSLE